MLHSARCGYARLAIITVALLSACGEKASEEEKESEPAVPVAVAVVQRGAIEAAYKGTATIEADKQATVVAKISGIVESIRTEEGQAVKAGDALAQLEQERLQLELARARANYQQLKAEFGRNERVLQQKLVSREQYDRSRFELQAAKAALDLAELSLRESTILAPIDGVVSGRHIKVGNTVQVNAALFDITHLEALEAQLHVPEREIHKLKPGQPALISVDAWPGDRFQGQVQRINPVVDPASGTVKVTVALDNPDGKLLPGMFGRLQVLYDRREDALLIPKDAVVIEDASASVFVIVDGKAERRTVELGYDNDRDYEVLSGLSENERVVTIGRASLKDGAPAEIVGDNS